jgi:hypothetical protein
MNGEQLKNMKLIPAIPEEPAKLNVTVASHEPRWEPNMNATRTKTKQQSPETRATEQ